MNWSEQVFTSVIGRSLFPFDSRLRSNMCVDLVIANVRFSSDILARFWGLARMLRS